MSDYGRICSATVKPYSAIFSSETPKYGTKGLKLVPLQRPETIRTQIVLAHIPHYV